MPRLRQALAMMMSYHDTLRRLRAARAIFLATRDYRIYDDAAADFSAAAATSRARSASAAILFIKSAPVLAAPAQPFNTLSYAHRSALPAASLARKPRQPQLGIDAPAPTRHGCRAYRPHFAPCARAGFAMMPTPKCRQSMLRAPAHFSWPRATSVSGFGYRQRRRCRRHAAHYYMRAMQRASFRPAYYAFRAGLRCIFTPRPRRRR